MPTSSQPVSRFRFGPFELDPLGAKLLRNGLPVKLQDLPFRLLVLLVEHAGEIVSRDELRERLWPGNTFVEFDNSLGVAIRKVREALKDDAESALYVETVPRRGYRFIASVEKVVVKPADAPEPLRESADLPSRPNTSGNEAHRSRSSRASYVLAAICVVLVLVAAAIYKYRSSHSQRPAAAVAESATAAVPVRKAVAVLGFRNLAGRPEDAWLSPAFSEMLSTELASGGLRLVPGEDVATAEREMPISDADTLAKPTLLKLRQNPGADVVLLGTYTTIPGDGHIRIRLDMRMQDTASGETIAEESVTGDQQDLFELASQAGALVLRRLGNSSYSPEAEIQARTLLPANQDALRLYSEGRARLWAFDALGARDLLVKSVAADPKYPLSHAALSEAWWQLGFDQKSKDEAQRALDLSGPLPREEQLLLTGQYERTRRDWPKAVEAYQSLFSLYPDNLNYGLLLASAQIHVKTSDALKTLDALRRLPPPEGNDARIDMTEVSVWITSDLTRARAAANTAIQKGKAEGSYAVVGRTQGILCELDPGMGNSAEGMSECENAMEISIAEKNPNGEAMMRTDLAALYFERGDLPRAESMWRQALKQFRQVGNTGGAATTLLNLSAVALLQGEIAVAKQLLTEALPQFRELGDTSGIALTLNNLGDASERAGELNVAEDFYTRARTTAEPAADKDAIAYVMSGLGQVQTDRGDLLAAKKSYEQSLALRTELGEKQLAAESEVSLARLLTQQGQPADAETKLRTLASQFHTDLENDDELSAETGLIEAITAQHKPAEAAVEVERISPLAAKTTSRLERFQFDLARGRVLAESGDLKGSRAELAHVLADARTLHFRGVEFEARLALAQLDQQAGATHAAQTQIVSLKKNATRDDFGLIARKASLLIPTADSSPVSSQ
jgi:eukaryotic-like serine/threonine-protein kinase